MSGSEKFDVCVLKLVDWFLKNEGEEFNVTKENIDALELGYSLTHVNTGVHVALTVLHEIGYNVHYSDGGLIPGGDTRDIIDVNTELKDKPNMVRYTKDAATEDYCMRVRRIKKYIVDRAASRVEEWCRKNNTKDFRKLTGRLKKTFMIRLLEKVLEERIGGGVEKVELVLGREETNKWLEKLIDDIDPESGCLKTKLNFKGGKLLLNKGKEEE